MGNTCDTSVISLYMYNMYKYIYVLMAMKGIFPVTRVVF